MFQKRATCGHCQRLADFTFDYVTEKIFPGGIPGLKVSSFSTSQNDPGPVAEGYGTARCPMCQQPNMFLFKTRYGHLKAIKENLNSDVTLMGGGSLMEVIATYPSPIAALERDEWPAALRPIFRDAQLMLAEKKAAAMIVSACRSVLEVASKELGATGNNLAQRIDDLAAKGKITADMQDWSHRVRVAGNEAVHEIIATHDEASELIRFVTYLLDMCFSIPKTSTPKP